MATKNSNLHTAKKLKNDEFYTQLTDIENELKYYRQYFKDKVVYCNCDDARESNFFKFFSLNFEFLGLKKLITTGYKENGKGVVLIYEGDKNGNRMPDLEEIEIKELQGSGDFRSEECIEYLKQADIVVTNPPFSLFRDYVATLVEYGKQFLIIGNKNAITYKEIFPLIKENKLWLGISSPNEYRLPNGEITKQVNGLCKWFTNLEHKKRNYPLDLYMKYSNEYYKKYDNYDAIEVSKTCEIPMDYEGVMGVPITFLHKYNPNQFEIIKFRKGNDDKDLSINGKCPYFRILIRHKR